MKKQVAILLAVVFLVLILPSCVQKAQPFATQTSMEPAPAAKESASGSQVSISAQSQKKDTAKHGSNILSTYSTDIYDFKKGRMKNIKISIKAINCKVIKPGEVFSFNDTVGIRSAKKGYEEALVFINGEKVMDEGGGVCQVSTTLYNAAKNAGLEIVEVNHHSRKVPYEKEGKDATVSYGLLDLKLKNNFDFPVKINMWIYDKKVRAQISRA